VKLITKHDPFAVLLSHLHPFAASSPAELKVIGRSCTVVNRRSGSVLASEGSPSREFFVVVSGTAVVTRNGLAEAVLRTGDSFGAPDLLAKRESSAGLVALSDVELIVMSTAEFCGLLETAPSFRRRVVQGLADRARAGT